MVILIGGACASGFFIFQEINHRPVVTIVYIGEKGDLGYLDQAFLGLTRAVEDMQISTREIVWNESAEIDPVTDKEGVRADMVLMLGDAMAGYAERTSHNYPQVPVVIIDAGPVQGPHIRSVSFSMYGASYLAGILAANQTKTGKIGVIAGKDAPVISRFTDGFIDGAHREDQDVLVTITYLANDDTGFTMPEKAGLVAEDMYHNGTDVIFTVAGGSGPGAISAAKNLTGLYIIGVDSDQSELAPEIILGSVVKNLDAVVYREVQRGLNGSFVPGYEETGLFSNGSSLVQNPVFSNLSSLIESWTGQATEMEEDYLFHSQQRNILQETIA